MLFKNSKKKNQKKKDYQSNHGWVDIYFQNSCRFYTVFNLLSSIITIITDYILLTNFYLLEYIKKNCY